MREIGNEESDRTGLFLEGLEYGLSQTQITMDLLEQAMKTYSPFGEYSRGVIEGYQRGIAHSHFGLMALAAKIKKAKEELESSFEELALSELEWVKSQRDLGARGKKLVYYYFGSDLF